MRIAVVVVGLAGCFSAAPASGVPCDPDAPACPHGQACVIQGGAYVCSSGDGDAPDATTAAGDGDGDGVLDAEDNCPARSNPAQDNYDGDRFGDACDPCPPLANNAPVDGDGDGVSDDCDPDPGVAGDRIVRFDAFRTLAGWDAVGGFTISADGARVDLTTGATASLTMPITVATRTSVTASFTASTLRTFAGHAGMGVVQDGVQCAVIRNPTTDEHIALIDTDTESAMAAGDFALDVDRPYTSTITAAGIDRYRCRAATTELAAGMVSPPTTVGLRARGVRGTFHWVLVIEAP